MSGAKPVTLPISQQFKLSNDQAPSSEGGKKIMAKIPYANAVGSLMYAMVCTRPDIAYSVSLVSIFMSNPRKVHWQSLKWILRYIKGSLGKGLVYGGAYENSYSPVAIEGFVDSDYDGCLDTRKSLTGKQAYKRWWLYPLQRQSILH